MFTFNPTFIGPYDPIMESGLGTPTKPDALRNVDIQTSSPSPEYHNSVICLVAPQPSPLLLIEQGEEDPAKVMASRRLERRPSLCKQSSFIIVYLNFLIVSPDDVDKLYHHFLRIDADGNGVIDRQELMTLPSVSGNPLAGRLLELFDTDQSGDINFGEFVSGLSIFSSRTDPKKKLRFAFDIYDLDQDGYISNGELFVALRLMTGEHLKPVQLQQIVDKTIRDADLDGDGRISFDEFCTIVERNNGELIHKWSVADI